MSNFTVNDFTYDTNKFAEFKIQYKEVGKIRPVGKKRFFSIKSATGERIIADRVPDINSLRATPKPYIEVDGFKYDIKKFAEHKIDFKNGKIKSPWHTRYVSLKTKTAAKIIALHTGKNKKLLRWVKPVEVKEEKEFKYHVDRKSGFITHFMNNPELQSNESKQIINKILPVLRDVKRKHGITDKGMIHIKFEYKRSENRDPYYKPFKSYSIAEFKQKFTEQYDKFTEINASGEAGSQDYTRTIGKIILTFIPENRGGCNPERHPKVEHIEDTVHTAPRTGEMKNNCLFKCLVECCDFECKRFKSKRGNEIRKEFSLPADSQIPISTALKIFEKYGKPEYSLQITDCDTLKVYKNEKGKTMEYLALTDNHYTIVKLKDFKRCKDCFKKYLTKHTCNAKMVTYANAFLKKEGERSRCLLTRTSYEKETINNQVLHYDIETYQKMLATGEVIHTCYIVGYTDPLDNHKFKYFTGDNCMSLFCDEILRIAEVFGKKKLYINAFNGANFDHYYLYKEYLKKNIIAKNARQSGSIISCKYKNIAFFDVCKHLQGSLSQNLKSFKCEIQKGDFDHDLASRWEDMKENLREDCIKYLRSDVVGLRELFDKLNNSVFKEYKVNITSYISTSSLSFNLWKRTLKGFDIRLPNLEQEGCFRQSVRGGRCYKSKSGFVSKQYESYKKNEAKFEDIDDYIIDADVVSLYPAAMTQFEFPVGECLKSVGGEMKGKMGIWKIKYTANKRLAHAILGRRDTKLKKLIWDLTDSEGWYTSVEIEDALQNGYQVEILEGYYWKETKPVFKEYIEELFKKKGELAKQGKKGGVEYLLSKLFMNSLYGKMIQRPIFNKTKNITSVSEYWKFFSQHYVDDIVKIRDGLYEVSGTPRDIIDTEKQITKPTQMGAFILAYSRRIMMGYIKEANPYFDHQGKYQKEQIENDIHYTDTDSLQMKAGCAQRIKNLGKKSLGMITDDLGDGCKIIRGLWISPKLYMLEYIKKAKPEEIFYHFRGKGLSADKLSPELYDQMAEGKAYTNVRDFQMKKIAVKRNSNQKNIPMFSIQHFTDISKTVNSSRWAGRRFDTDYQYSVPHGSDNTHL